MLIALLLLQQGLLLHSCSLCMHMASSSSMQMVQSGVKRTCMCGLGTTARPEADSTCLLSAGCGAWCMALT